MKLTRPNKSEPSPSAKSKSHELLFKGIFISLVGLGVLLAPGFMASGEMRDMVAQSYWVGWFALLLGSIFTAQSVIRLFRSGR